MTSASLPPDNSLIDCCYIKHNSLLVNQHTLAHNQHSSPTRSSPPSRHHHWSLAAITVLSIRPNCFLNIVSVQCVANWPQSRTLVPPLFISSKRSISALCPVTITRSDPSSIVTGTIIASWHFSPESSLSKCCHSFNYASIIITLQRSLIDSRPPLLHQLDLCV